MNALQQLRVIAYVEGLSFLALLFVAMPLKYLAGLPLAVRVVGLVHGILFVGFLVALARVTVVRRWPVSRVAFAFVASLVPFGTFALDRSLKQELAVPSP